MADFSGRLKELRKLNGISQRELAEITGISERGIQGCEYGKYSPKLVTLLTLADYFNVSIDYLVGRTDNPEINR